MKKTSIINYSIFTIIIILSLIMFKGCTYAYDAYKEHNISFDITGYYNNYGTPYIFCHNDKYGDYTFKVDVTTLYNTMNGDSIYNTAISFNNMSCNANDTLTTNFLFNNYKDFNLTKYKAYNYHIINDICIGLWFISLFLAFTLCVRTNVNKNLSFMEICCGIISMLIVAIPLFTIFFYI